LYVLAFVRLPDQAAYLLPIVPPTILLLGRFLPRPHFVLRCALLALSPLAGTALLEQRAQFGGQLASVDYVKNRALTLPPGSVVALGEWQPLVEAAYARGERHAVEFVYQVDPRQVREYLAAGRAVYFAPEPSGGAARGQSLDATGALPIPPPPLRAS
jgi:hypothetical protein